LQSLAGKTSEKMYKVNDKFLYNTDPKWSFVDSERNTFNTKPKYDFYNREDTIVGTSYQATPR